MVCFARYHGCGHKSLSIFLRVTRKATKRLPILTESAHLFNILFRTSQNIRRRSCGMCPYPFLTRLACRSATCLRPHKTPKSKAVYSSKNLPHVLCGRFLRFVTLQGISSITWTVHVSHLTSPRRLVAISSTSSIP